MADKLSRLEPSPFKDGPGEFLVYYIAKYLREESHFKMVFGDTVDDYDREDYSMRELPAMRFYTFQYTKEHESHYITGNVFCDVILPPSIRRKETEKIPSQLATALIQQFRRPSFFASMQAVVPGLNELGKVFAVDKSLTFQNTTMEDECPVVHITINFRLDLKQWDEYLELQGRTIEDPFDVTLANLETIATTIQGTDDSGNVDITINGTQTLEG